MVLRVGITGGIGSGKSIVANIFSVFGIPVFDADTAAKQIMNEDEELKKNILEKFGKESYANGRLNRKYIAGIVFNDPQKLELLNSLVHPVTILAAEKWMQQQTSPYALKEAALLFESGAAAYLDYVIGVSAPEHIRIQRVMERDHISREEVLNRMNRQMDEEIKMRLCDFLIVNDEQQPVIPQALQVHEQLLKIIANGKSKPG